jgi:5-methylcytosine-specific restriction enzyme A
MRGITRSGDRLMTFVPGQIYKRVEVHRAYGGQRQSGISTPTNHPFLLLFTGDQGEQYGYHDEWTADGVFLLTGEGQRGDMSFVRGNAALRDHIQDGKDLHLFKCLPKKGFIQYMDQMVCIGHRWRTAPDRDGAQRRVIVFELLPLEAFNAGVRQSVPREDVAHRSLAELRQRALESPAEGATPQQRLRTMYARSEAVSDYVRLRAAGMCEGCGEPAPFVSRRTGEAYLEPHHTRRLSDGGPDHPRSVIALCPTCHRRAHYAVDSHEYNLAMRAKVEAIEPA